MGENEYDNWRERQRGFLENTGHWHIVHATEKRPFYCIKDKPAKTKPYYVGNKKDVRCKNLFANNENMFQGGQWAVKRNKISEYVSFDQKTAEERVEEITLGNKFRFRCDNQRRVLKVICVRVSDTEAALVKCKSRGCGSFDRISYDDIHDPNHGNNFCDINEKENEDSVLASAPFNPPKGCSNIFTDDLFDDGRWSVKFGGYGKSVLFNRHNVDERLTNISFGSKFRFECKRRKAFMSLICVRSFDKKRSFISRCIDPKCKTFNRIPFNLKLLNTVC